MHRSGCEVCDFQRGACLSGTLLQTHLIRLQMLPHPQPLSQGRGEESLVFMIASPWERVAGKAWARGPTSAGH